MREWCDKNHSDGAYQIALLEKFLCDKGLLKPTRKPLLKQWWLEWIAREYPGCNPNPEVHEELRVRQAAADRLRDALRRIECDESMCRRIREALNAAYDDGLFKEVK